MAENKVLTEEAREFIDQETGFQVFDTPNEYIEYIFAETNLHDAIPRVKDLGRIISGYTLTQNLLPIVGDADEVRVDVEDLLKELSYDGDIFEEEG